MAANPPLGAYMAQRAVEDQMRRNAEVTLDIRAGIKPNTPESYGPSIAREDWIGHFNRGGESLHPMKDAKSAEWERTLEFLRSGKPIVYGVDMGEEGGDQSVVTELVGQDVIWSGSAREWEKRRWHAEEARLQAKNERWEKELIERSLNNSPTSRAPARSIANDKCSHEDRLTQPIDQALSDPENQPSQWGTIPVSMAGQFCEHTTNAREGDMNPNDSNTLAAQQEARHLSAAEMSAWQQKRANKDRRERIAKDLLAGYIASGHSTGSTARNVSYALEHADALIAELDKP